MAKAEFEEKEYESHLYHQLGSQHSKLWAPGQVLEKHIGFDQGIYTVQKWLFKHHGHLSHAKGAVMSRYTWPGRWPQGPNLLPNFKLNLFIQAKRPEYFKKLPTKLQGQELEGEFWRFKTLDHQQKALELVSKTLKNRALITYASPVYHTKKDLFKHIRNGTVVKHSTFPTPIMLKNHSAWNYNEPGSKGIANEVPEFKSEISLEERIANLISQNSEQDESATSLRTLSQSIRSAIADTDVEPNSSFSRYFSLMDEMNFDLKAYPNMNEVNGYLGTLIFCEAFDLDWFVIG